MTTQESKRKLTAILSADVKGYRRLMSQDEEATVKTLKQHRGTISGHVSEHRGRVVDSPGDNILAEFGSVVDSVKCAVRIQETLKGTGNRTDREHSGKPRALLEKKPLRSKTFASAIDKMLACREERGFLKMTQDRVVP